MPIYDFSSGRSRARGGRRTGAPALLWLMLGLLVIVGFVAFAEWGLGPPL